MRIVLLILILTGCSVFKHDALYEKCVKKYYRNKCVIDTPSVGELGEKIIVEPHRNNN